MRTLSDADRMDDDAPNPEFDQWEAGIAKNVIKSRTSISLHATNTGELMNKMEDGTWRFDATTFEEVITAAGIADDDSKVCFTGKRLKELVPALIGLRDDLVRCHELLTKRGIPDLGGGTQGLVKRLEFLCK